MPLAFESLRLDSLRALESVRALESLRNLEAGIALPRIPNFKFSGKAELARGTGLWAAGCRWRAVPQDQMDQLPADPCRPQATR